MLSPIVELHWYFAVPTMNVVKLIKKIQDTQIGSYAADVANVEEC